MTTEFDYDPELDADPAERITKAPPGWLHTADYLAEKHLDPIAEQHERTREALSTERHGARLMSAAVFTGLATLFLPWWATVPVGIALWFMWEGRAQRKEDAADKLADAARAAARQRLVEAVALLAYRERVRGAKT